MEAALDDFLLKLPARAGKPALQIWKEFTSETNLLDEEMARGLGRYLRRTGRAGRVVQVSGRVENVIEEWGAE